MYRLQWSWDLKMLERCPHFMHTHMHTHTHTHTHTNSLGRVDGVESMSLGLEPSRVLM